MNQVCSFSSCYSRLFFLFVIKEHVFKLELYFYSLQVRLVRVAIICGATRLVSLVMYTIPAYYIISASSRTEAHSENKLALKCNLKEGQDLVTLRIHRKVACTPISTILNVIFRFFTASHGI